MDPHSASTRRFHRGRVWPLAAIVGLLASQAPVASAEATASLGVSASVSGCAGGGGAITCQVDVSFGSIAGAEYYTAEVTAPGGGSQSFGRVSPGWASLPVSWTGNGEYVVTISAWGSDPDQALARDSAR